MSYHGFLLGAGERKRAMGELIDLARRQGVLLGETGGGCVTRGRIFGVPTVRIAMLPKVSLSAALFEASAYTTSYTIAEFVAFRLDDDRYAYLTEAQ